MFAYIHIRLRPNERDGYKFHSGIGLVLQILLLTPSLPPAATSFNSTLIYHSEKRDTRSYRALITETQLVLYVAPRAPFLLILVVMVIVNVDASFSLPPSFSLFPKYFAPI